MRHRRVSRRTFHLRSERGVSLVASLLVLAFFSISATSAVYFSSRTSSGAEFSAEATDSLALAESGMNLARSTLFSAPDPTDSSAVPFTQATIEGELVEYWGVYDATTSTWTLTGKGTVLNPNDGSDILRAAESKVAVTAGGGSGQLWDYSSASPSGCMTVSNNAEFDSPLNVDGDLCIRNNGYFTGDSLNVGGTLTVNNNASVGFFGSPIDSANVAGGCTGGVPNPHACTSSDDVYSATPITQDPYSYTPPTIDWATWYADASPGPGHGCTSGSFPGGFDSNSSLDGSRGTVDLTPNSSYDCQTSSGRIGWNKNTKILTVDGTIFFDGPITMNNNDKAVYQGSATIYARGKVRLSNNVELCGVSGCNGNWDPGANSLVIVAYHPSATAFDISNNATYQGGAILEGNYVLTNNAANWGPVIGDDFSVENNSGTFTPVPLPPGTPLSGGGGGSATLTNVDGSYRSYTPGS